jgi:hypothetical protein
VGEQRGRGERGVGGREGMEGGEEGVGEGEKRE